ncbi:8705_t:CDS:2 [Cetraspora pellucida]|uniref:8705_t:CDS:1 n=1 Tax=Cetraspora pellucida TaxID=1433469 RepID=A0ACA9KVX0_9GLOM|nr:8705_t:CDS:2 [Cetraspora pellucida]
MQSMQQEDMYLIQWIQGCYIEFLDLIDPVNNNNPTHPVNNDLINPVNNDPTNSVNNNHTNLQSLLQSFANMCQVWPLHQQVTIQFQLEELVNIPPVVLEEPVTSKL